MTDTPVPACRFFAPGQLMQEGTPGLSVCEDEYPYDRAPNKNAGFCTEPTLTENSIGHCSYYDDDYHECPFYTPEKAKIVAQAQLYDPDQTDTLVPTGMLVLTSLRVEYGYTRYIVKTTGTQERVLHEVSSLVHGTDTSERIAKKLFDAELKRPVADGAPTQVLDTEETPPSYIQLVTSP